MNTVERARGRWAEILPRLGIALRFLHNRHGPCPLCGGKDRFRFDDREGSGSYYCNQCGPGPGIMLVRNRRVFVRIDPADGIPDGSTVDAEGYLWSTHWGGWCVTRFAPDGRIDRVVKMPVNAPTSCAFGGEDLSTLYITSASIDFGEGGWVYMSEEQFAANPIVGGIFAVEVGVRGLPEPAFRG